MSPPRIFDAHRRTLRFRRAAQMPVDNQWLVTRMATDLSDRLTAVRRTFADVALIGLGGGVLNTSNQLQSSHCTMLGPNTLLDFEEDRLPLRPGSLDLVLACGTLDSVNDLPGALILMRRALRPGGLFLAVLSGAGSLPGMRHIVAEAQQLSESAAVARFHPAIDVRAAGDLLGRAGFVLPVAESEIIAVTYRSFATLVADVRGAAMTNALADLYPMSRAMADALRRSFDAATDADGRFREEYSLLYLTGWAPEAATSV